MSGSGVNGNVKENDQVPNGNYRVVVYDLETTGKSLIDEICHIGCYAPKQPESKEVKPVVENGDPEERTDMYCQYIMPHRNLSFSARNAYGLVVVSLDYQRMLRDIDTGKLLKTKSEISALKDWMKWLEEVKGDSDGIILVHHAHDQTRDLNVALLLLALARYNLTSQFSNIVKGFCNSVNVISDLGDKTLITSLSLRSLCKTVLKDTKLPTRTAKERCTRLNDILMNVISPDTKLAISADKVLPYSQSVRGEQGKLAALENLQKAQYSMRPIFAEHFSSGYKLRSQMVGIRRMLAEQGLDYNKMVDLDKQDKLINELEKLEMKDEDHKSLMVQTVSTHFKGKAEKLVNGGTEEESVSETVTKQPTNNSNSPDKPSQN